MVETRARRGVRIAGRAHGGVRLYSSPKDQPRVRRATDLILLSVCGGLLTLVLLAAVPQSGIERAIQDVVGATPDFLVGIWQFFWALLTAWAVVLIFAAAIRGRGTLVRDLLGAGLAAFVIGWIAIELLGGNLDLPEVFGSTGPAWVPSVRLGITAAIVIVASPHVSRPFRQVGHWVILLGALAVVFIGASTVSGGIAGVLVGAIAAAVVHLTFGSSAGRPGIADVHNALEQLGVEAASLEPADRQSAGVFLVRGVDAQGRRIVAKVYGRDAQDTRLVAKVWRALWYRGADGAFTLTRLQEVEHEAFLTVFAAQRGVAVPEVIAAGPAGNNDALLVLGAHGRPLVDVPAELVTDELLASLWHALIALHQADIAHGQVDASRLAIDDTGTPMFLDLSEGALAGSDEARATDLARMFVTTAAIAGPDRAIAVAREALDADTLGTMLPFVQDAAVGGELAHQVKHAHLDVDSLREQLGAAAGVELPELAKLRRVSVRTLVQMGLFSVAAYALVASLANLDLDELLDALANAEWAWVILGFFLGQTPRITQALSTRSASPIRLPIGPLTALQLAISFINLAIPSSAARVAVNVRFFQRQGLPPAGALSVGLIDSIGGFVVQIAILVLTLVFGLGGVELTFNRSSSDHNWSALVIVLVIAAILAIAIAVVIRRIRQVVVAKTREWSGQVWTVVRGLSAARVFGILGANLASEVLFALTLGVMLEAFGTSLPLVTLLTINVAASLFAGLMPVPGGIGVTEGALIAGLTAAGVNEATAFAAVMTYRMAVFYLPPIWGAFAFHWLERHKYL